MRALLSALTGVLCIALATPSLAESEVSFYTGFQSAPHSRVYVDDPGGVGKKDFGVGWEGKSFEAPPYYGFRYTRWQSDTFGWGVEFNHAKVYTPDNILRREGFSNLEFTDGLNLLTVNGFYRWKDRFENITPYVGGGVGLAIPHVDVKTAAGTTFGYQVTGPAIIWVAGASYDLNERWALFGEYKGSFSMNTADLDGGGTLETDIVTNALNIGVTYKF